MTSSVLPPTDQVPSSCFSVIFSGDRRGVLLVRRRDMPLWVLPGGGIEHGEDPASAGCREAHEETGYQLRLVRKVAEYLPTNFMTQPVHFFELEIAGGSAQLTDETSGIDYFPLDALPDNLFFLHRAWIEDAVSESPTLIQRPQREAHLPRIFWEIVSHPGRILQYLLNRWGIAWPVQEKRR